MMKLILAGLVVFLLYTNNTFKSYTIEALKSVTNFIQEMPQEKNDNDNDEYKGFSTYK